MKIALFLDSCRFKVLDKDVIHAIVFEMVDGVVVSIDDEILSKKNLNYILLWLVSHNIKEVCIASVDEPTRAYLKRLGVGVKTYEDIKDNKLLMSFLG